MQNLQEWEAAELMNIIQFAHRNEWEQCRFQSYLMLQMNSKKKLKFRDIMSFAWDGNNGQDYEISNNDVKQLSEMAKMMEKNISGG